MGTAETITIGNLILKVLHNIEDPSVEQQVKQEVLHLTSQFPVPGILTKTNHT
jgi:glycine/serine hydroxymethyltransferase